MKFALLGYDLDGSLDQLPADAKGALHRDHGELHKRMPAGDHTKLVAHYRFRPSPLATIRCDASDGAAIRIEGAASTASATLRALYIVDSDDPEAVIQLAKQLPATLQGATIEVWPLTEPHASH